VYFLLLDHLKGLKPAGRLTKEAFSNQKNLMLKAADDPNHPEFLKFLETDTNLL